MVVRVRVWLLVVYVGVRLVDRPVGSSGTFGRWDVIRLWVSYRCNVEDVKRRKLSNISGTLTRRRRGL